MLSVIEVMANSRQVLQNCKELKKIHPFISGNRYKGSESNVLAELGRHLQVLPTMGRMLLSCSSFPLSIGWMA